MTEPGADPLNEFLESCDALGAVQEDVGRMVAGYRALLTQAARWDEEAKALYARAKDFHDVRGVHLMVRAEATALRAGELRDVIAASLLGEDGS